MNVKHIIGVVLFVYLVTLGQGNAQVRSGQHETDRGVVLAVDLRKAEKKELQYTFELRNDGSKAVFYGTNPRQVDGVFTPYVSVDEKDSTLVNVQWRVFHPAIILVIENGGVNKAGIELKRLEPGETIRDTVFIKWPLAETVPPYLRRVYKKVEQGTIKRLRFTVGYFEEEEGILEFLTRKPFGWFIKGHERLDTGVFKGKEFYEIQKLVSLEVSIPDIKD